MSPIKNRKKRFKLQEETRPLTSGDNDLARPDSEAAVTRHAEAKRLHTLMSAFPDIKPERRRPPRDPPAPPCLLHSALTQKLMCADTSARRIIRKSIGARSVKLSLQIWQVITGPGADCCTLGKTNCSHLTNMTGATVLIGEFKTNSLD